MKDFIQCCLAFIVVSGIMSICALPTILTVVLVNANWLYAYIPLSIGATWLIRSVLRITDDKEDDSDGR